MSKNVEQPIKVYLDDMLAPGYIEVDFNHIQIDNIYYRTIYVSRFPRIVPTNWLSPIINYDHSLIISTFYYPLETQRVLSQIKKKIGEMEATLLSQVESGKVIDPSVKVALDDAQKIQESIASGEEKFFQFGLYITIEALSIKELDKVTTDVMSLSKALDLECEKASLKMEQGFQTSLPTGGDKLFWVRNLNTSSIATTFPFVTSELTMDHGVLYGVNIHNNSLVVFDRFELENANNVIFARSGSGKSYFVKLEVFRSIMLGTEVIVIDPEREYENLCKSLGGLYITFSQNQGSKVNPFEMAYIDKESKIDQLREKILSLQKFFNILYDGMTSIEKSIMDKAIIMTYNEKGITTDPRTQTKEPPLLEDLYKVLKGFIEPEAFSLAKRLERFIVGSAAGVFNEPTNIKMDNILTVFSLRDLQEDLRPIAMYVMLDYIWTHVRKIRKRRILVVEEAWYMMQRADSAEFMYSMAKRARKYYLGITTISQDVDDFLSTDYGRAVMNNSAMQVLLKQSQTAIDKIEAVFKLTSGERDFLLRCNIGEGLFFAGNQHVAIKGVSSLAEHRLMTTDPKEIEKFIKLGVYNETDPERLAHVFSTDIISKFYE